jgi:uncharacterized protein YciI/uncharacterized protein YndB with AHSA1/START domain
MNSIKKQITVATSQERAFRVFTDGIDRWWPREHHIGASPLERSIIEPFAGGRWFARCQDGSEVDTGRVLTWQPPSRLVLTWQITAAWKFDPDFVTEVEVSFIAEGPRSTRVELEHRHLERYGEAAAKMIETFEGPEAWTQTLGLFGGATTAPKYLLTYESTAASRATAPTHFPAHRERLDRFHARGTLLMVGNLVGPSGRALGVFTTRQAAEEFVGGDPFVQHGVVVGHTIDEWNEVLA